jgi:flagellar biosynthetic protein FliP
MSAPLTIPNAAEAFRMFGFFIIVAITPFVLVLMTSFTRISIILTFVRQALGTVVPSSHIITGLSLILTGYVMHPVLTKIYDEAMVPYLNHEFKTEDKSAELHFVEQAWPPLRHFMLEHTREKDLELFIDLGKVELPENASLEASDLPWYAVVPAFVLSELRCAFLMGFLLFLPFLVIDLVVTSLLMSMGMIMLPPAMISFPFKLLLFIVVDGWHLIVQQVVHGYQG